MKNATDLDRPANDDVEHEVVVDDQHPIPQPTEAAFVRPRARSGESREPPEGTVESVDECLGAVRSISSDEVEDVEEVALSEGQILDAVEPPHRTRARSLRIIAQWPIRFAPRAACASASPSLRYRSSCACSRS